MVRGVARLTSFLCLTIVLAGCPEPGLRESEKARNYSAAGKTTVVVLDVSGSMNQADPDRVSVEGTQLIASLIENGDNAGAVRFSSSARVAAPLRTIKNPADRHEFCQEIARARREGSTNFVEALERAREVLEGVNAPAGSTVLFMTDGEHNTGGSREDVLAQVATFRSRGWKIHALGYSSEGRTELLSELATRTGGGFFVANTPRELLIAYIKILTELEGFFIAPEIRPVRLFPKTSRLLYVVLKGRESTHFSTVTRDDAPVPLSGPTTYHYPGEGEQSRAFEVLRFENPEPGRYHGRVEGPYDVGLILQKAPFEFTFATGAPKREQVDGHPVTVTLLVSGEAVGEIAPASAADATVTAFDGRSIAQLRLAPGGAPAPNTLAFTGSFTPRLKDPKTPETHTVNVRFTYRDGDVVWTHERTVSYRLVPPPPGGIEIEPAAVDLGTIFAGETPRDVEVKVRALGADAKDVAIETSPGATANPRMIPRISAPEHVRIALDAPATTGPASWSATFRPGGQGDDALVATLAIKANVVRLKAPAGIALGDVEAGGTASAPVEISGDDPRVELTPLAGPKGGSLEARLVTKDGKQTLEVPVSSEAAPGSYSGSVRVTVGGATKTIPVTLRVTPQEAKLTGLPERIAFSAKKNGWTPDMTYETSLVYFEPCAVAISTSDLAPAGGKGRAVRANQEFKVALDGVEGDRVPPGRPVKLKAKVYVTADLRPGTYEGKVAFTVRSADGRQSVREVPVELSLTR